jgi:predicted TIM-barrel enzyme
LTKAYSRTEVVARLRKTNDEGRPILVGSTSTGMSAKFAEKGGCDMVAVYSVGYFRWSGQAGQLAFMPYGDANEIVLEKLAPHVLPAVKEIPVIAGIGAHDPFRRMEDLLKRATDMGFSGVQNVPFTGFYGDHLNKELEAGGIGFSREVEMIRKAHQREMFTIGFAFTPEQGEKMAEAGADMIVPHCGLTTGGDKGASISIKMDEAVQLTQSIVKAAKAVNPNLLFVSHGGPIESPEEVKYVLEHTDVNGYFAGSGLERIPIEKALVETTKEFKALQYKK